MRSHSLKRQTVVKLIVCYYSYYSLKRLTVAKLIVCCYSYYPYLISLLWGAGCAGFSICEHKTHMEHG